MVNIEIRQEEPSDFRRVNALNRNVFGRDNEAKLVDALRASDAFLPELSLVALLHGKVVGHILFTKIIIRSDNGNTYQSLSLAPMAVDKSFQKQGIGSQMVNAGLRRAKELYFKSVIVLGHEKYYPRFGFKPASNWNIRAPFDVPENAFMALELVSSGLEGINGTGEYAKEFESV